MRKAACGRLGAAFPFVITLLLVAFHYGRFLEVQLQPPGPSFGRPLELASSDIPGSTAAQVTPGGDLLVLWSVRGGIDYALVSPQALVKARGHLPLQVDTPTASPTSLLAGPSALFWLAGPSLTELYWAPFTPAGPSLGSPVRLAGGISSLRLLYPVGLLAAGPDGLLWFPLDVAAHPGRPQPLPRPGMTLADGVVVAPGRVAVVGAVAERGSLRLEYLELGEAVRVTHPLPLGEYRLEEHELVTHIRCASDGEWMYLFVTRQKKDKGDVSIRNFWQAWPATAPPSGPAPGLTELALARVADRQILWLAEPEPAPYPQAGAVAVAFTAVNRGPRGQDEDVLVAEFRGGRLADCQFAALTRGAAGQPRLVPPPAGGGRDGGYFLTWVDTAGWGRFRLRLTASVPAYRQAMARVRPSDLMGALGETAAGMFFSYLPFLFAMGWTVPAFLVLVAVHAVALNWAEHNPRPLAVATLVIYLGVKAWVLWRLLHAPVLAMRAPAWVTPALTPPVLVGAAALAAITLALRYHRSDGVVGVARFILWDVLFTCLFLGPFFR